MWNGYEFREKMKTLHFFTIGHLGHIYVVFIGLSHFLLAKPIKPTVFKNSGMIPKKMIFKYVQMNLIFHLQGTRDIIFSDGWNYKSSPKLQV